jgi:uncharacterized protein
LSPPGQGRVVTEPALNASPRTTGGPVTAGERLSLLDALRGFALAGVLLANLNSLTLYEFVSPEQRAALPTAAFDQWARMALVVFVSKKFLTLFSLLFGVGFAVQLVRSEARGAELVPTYVRRLVVLLVIGLAHGTLLYWGDILRFYAVLGFVLLLFRHASSRTLLWSSVVLACVGWPLLKGVTDPFVSPLSQRLPSRRTANAETFAIFSEGGYLDVVWRNPVQDMIDVARFWYLPFFVFGPFLLGFWAGGRGCFTIRSATVLSYAASSRAASSSESRALRWGSSMCPGTCSAHPSRSAPARPDRSRSALPTQPGSRCSFCGRPGDGGSRCWPRSAAWR